jgi:hypothetical protein
MVAMGAALLALSAAPRAQQAPEAENPARLQATRFEMALRSALELAGQRLAQQASKVAPSLTLQVVEPGVARGVRLNSYGFYFDVQAPDITSTIMVLEMMRRPFPSPVRPVGAGAAAQPAATLPPDFDSDRTYTNYVKEALIDALIDDSAVLSVSAGELITVAVSGIDRPNPNPLYSAPSAKLLLTIRANDLVEFRQGRLTREQAKERVAQERF